jgi:DNA-binding response OmpR family regulator
MKKILIVDDDIDIVEIVRTMLEGQGWKVTTAYSGEEALRSVSAEHPDLILLDIMMPRMTGMQVLQEVRAIAPEAKIIMITAFGDVSSYLDSVELGALEYVNKPFEPSELVATVRKVIAPGQEVKDPTSSSG